MFNYCILFVNKLDGIDYAIKKVRLRGDRIPEEKER